MKTELRFNNLVPSVLHLPMPCQRERGLEDETPWEQRLLCYLWNGQFIEKLLCDVQIQADFCEMQK